MLRIALYNLDIQITDNSDSCAGWIVAAIFRRCCAQILQQCSPTPEEKSVIAGVALLGREFIEL